MPGKPLAGPEFKDEEQLLGNLTPSVHSTCLDLDRPWGNKLWPQRGIFFSWTGTAQNLQTLPTLGNIFFSPKGGKMPFSSPSPIRGQGLCGPSVAELDPSRKDHPSLEGPTHVCSFTRTGYIQWGQQVQPIVSTEKFSLSLLQYFICYFTGTDNPNLPVYPYGIWIISITIYP